MTSLFLFISIYYFFTLLSTYIGKTSNGCYRSNKSTIEYSIEQAYKNSHPSILVFFLLLFFNIFLRHNMPNYFSIIRSFIRIV